jgi:radical SAM protein with 4Fe4S-binding SPASM domain
MDIRGFVPFSLIDLPGRIACIIFCGSCNFRCGYCHNPCLVFDPESQPEVTKAEIFHFLDRRRGKLDGIVISGGEPLVRPDTVRELIRRMRRTKGYHVGQIRLVTNFALADDTLIKALSKHEVIITISIHQSELGTSRWWEHKPLIRSLEMLKKAGGNNGGLVFIISSPEDWHRFIETPLSKINRYTDTVLVVPDLINWPPDLEPDEIAHNLLEYRQTARAHGLLLTGWWDKPAQSIINGEGPAFAWCPGISGGAIVCWPDGRLSRCKYLRPSQFATNETKKNRLAALERNRKEIPWESISAKQLRHVATTGCADCWLLPVCAGGCSLSWPERTGGDDRRCRFLRAITRGLLIERAQRAMLRREVREAIAILGGETL